MNRRNFLQGLAAFFTGARLLKPGQDVIVDPATLIIQPEAPQVAMPGAVAMPSALVRLEFADGYRVDVAPLSMEVEFSRELIDIHSLYAPMQQQLSAWTNTEMDMLTYANPSHHQRITEALRSGEEFLTRIRFPHDGHGYDVRSTIRAEALSLERKEPIKSRLLIAGTGKPEFIEMTGLARYKSVEGFSK